jgi:hypothetical protein
MSVRPCLLTEISYKQRKYDVNIEISYAADRRDQTTIGRRIDHVNRRFGIDVATDPTMFLPPIVIADIWRNGMR